ncbi:hypothetical protein Are01nite_13750 [Actinoplanes regularis]|nr:hypothetical protein Are01nite_13750 [Actinoplanes regularis]
MCSSTAATPLHPSRTPYPPKPRTLPNRTPLPSGPHTPPPEPHAPRTPPPEAHAPRTPPPEAHAPRASPQRAAHPTTRTAHPFPPGHTSSRSGRAHPSGARPGDPHSERAQNFGPEDLEEKCGSAAPGLVRR